jgi:hypothetical protein
MPVILRASQSSTATDMNGLANIVPTTSSFRGPVKVDVAVIAGTSGGLDYRFDVFPTLASRKRSDGTDPPPTARLPVRFGRWVEIRGR